MVEALVEGAAPSCRPRLEGLSELRLLFALPEFAPYVQKPTSPTRAAFQEALKAWSSDLLVKLVLDLEQNYAVTCPPGKKLRGLVGELKRAYLSRAGVTSTVRDADLEPWFRGLLALHDDLPALKKRVAAVKTKSPGVDFLKHVYGAATDVRGVIVVASRDTGAAAIRKRLAELCPTSGVCPFWDPAALYRVSVVPEDGISAFVPEVATLVLSESLLSHPHRLHRVVLTHELAHVAVRSRELRAAENWPTAFLGFSGWRQSGSGWEAAAVKTAVPRKDELVTLSESSAFSLLPDPVIVGGERDGSRFDGFVTAKAFEETRSRADVSEDLADHVAIFIEAPERFCHEGKALAPRKWKWIAANVFPRRKAPRGLTCSPAG